MDNNSTSFASPLASPQNGNINIPLQLEYVVDAVSHASLWTVLWTAVALAVAYDQISYIRQKGSIVGPSWKAPFIGPFLQSMHPKFSEYYGKWLSGELSCVSIFHKFVIIASTRDMSRKVFNSPTFVKPCVVDVAPKLLGADNWVFLDGKPHVDFRKGLNGLFTRQALECYLPGQEDVYNRYFKRFVQITKDSGGKPVPWMSEFREIITAVSLRTFCGHYVSDEGVKRIADDYYLITEALELVNFPFIIPFSKTWYGKKAADMVLDEFAKAAAKSKVRMNAGGEVSCIMDGWIKSMVDSRRWREAEARGEKTEKPTPLLREFSDYEIAQTVFTFLFASQDATSSAATWLFQIMAQRPDILDRVREENLQTRNGDIHAPLTLDQLESMKYTRAVVRELLRYRPPVLMVPYLAKKAFPITDTYTVPKGAMVIPSTYLSLRDPEVYENPDEFNPERYYTGDAEEKGAKNWLVFGTGPHYCLGQHYAMFNLALMIGKASLLMDWKHHPTPKSEEIKVFATIFPMDDCPLTFEDRKCHLAPEERTSGSGFMKHCFYPEPCGSSHLGLAPSHRRPAHKALLMKSQSLNTIVDLGPLGGTLAIVTGTIVTSAGGTTDRPAAASERAFPRSSIAVRTHVLQDPRQTQPRPNPPHPRSAVVSIDPAEMASTRTTMQTAANALRLGAYRTGVASSMPLLRCAAPRALRLSVPAPAPRHAAAALPSGIRRYSQKQPGESKIWSFEDIQKLTQDSKPNVVVVDVREPGELKSTGRVPGAVNIPVTSQPDSFHITEEDFEDRYGYPRPDKDQEVVFYCKAGVRSRAAAGLAKDAGWSKVGEYPGSWLDWAEKGGKVER